MILPTRPHMRVLAIRIQTNGKHISRALIKFSSIQFLVNIIGQLSPPLIQLILILEAMHFVHDLIRQPTYTMDVRIT